MCSRILNQNAFIFFIILFIYFPPFWSALALIFNGQNYVVVASIQEVLFENIFTQ